MDTPFAIGSSVWPGTAKALEECGELVQVLGKLIALGGQDAKAHWDGTNLNRKIHEEAADVLAAVEFLIEQNALDRRRIERRKNNKLKKFRSWQEMQ